MPSTPEQNEEPDGNRAHLDREELEIFLDSAPPALAGWVAEQRGLIADQPLPPSGADGPNGTHAVDDAVAPDHDESDDFYNDMEGEDDILQRGRRATGARPLRRSGGGRTATHPATGKKSAMSFPLRGVLTVALILGVAWGIWYAGQSTAEPRAATDGITTEQGSQADSAARIKELEAAVAANPKDVDARLELGVQYFNMRLIEQAREQWDAVIAVDEANVTAWYNLGFYYLSSDPVDMDAARAAWQRVIELDPGSEMATTVSMHLEGLTAPDDAPDDAPEE